MQNRKLMRGLPILLCAALFATAMPAWSSAESAKPAAAAVSAADMTVKGKVMGVSKKAKAITIETAKGPVMVKFDPATTGMEHAAAGEAAIIEYRLEGKDKIANEIKPKLATLPPGVSEISPRELAALIDDPKADFILVDSRPTARYAEGHIPSAITIPVEKMGEMAPTMLPRDHKDRLLLFYCGGVT